MRLDEWMDGIIRPETRMAGRNLFFVAMMPNKPLELHRYLEAQF